MRKIFIAIEPPEEIKEHLSSIRVDLPAKWTPKRNIHMTLIFIGRSDEVLIKEAGKAVKAGVGTVEKFDLEVTGLSYAPPGSRPPKMIWATISDSEPLKDLRSKICGVLGTESDEFIPHMTIARINAWKFRQLDEEEIPELPEESISFKVDSVRLMESKVFRGRVEYELIEKFELK